MSAKTVKVSHFPLEATERDLKELFSDCGDIQYVEMRSDTEQSQIAYVTFKDSRGADAAVLVSRDEPVTVTLDPDYQLPPAALAPSEAENKSTGGAESASANVASHDQKMGLNFRISSLTSRASGTIHKADRVSGKTIRPYAVIEHQVGSAKSPIINNPHVLPGGTWLTGAFNKVAKAAQKAKEKAKMSEDENMPKMVYDYAQVHPSASPKASAAS